MLKVLIAEDNILLADMLETFLSWKGYDVVGQARTVDEAVLLADLHEPDLAVFDFRLAHGEFGSQIRPLLKDKLTMGILFVSGDPLHRELTTADGEAYIQKPYELNDLVKALDAIREMKTNCFLSSTILPKSVNLLREAISHDLRVA